MPTQMAENEVLYLELKQLKKEMVKHSLSPAYLNEFHTWYIHHRLPAIRQQKHRHENLLSRLSTYSINALFFILITTLTTFAIELLYLSDWNIRLALESLEHRPCFLESLELVQEAFRPLSDCPAVCSDLTRVAIQEKMTREQFLKQFAYTGRPALVKGATRNWTAMSAFNYEFLKEVFTSSEDVIAGNEADCQFFPYKSSFSSLREAFNMSKSRSQLKEENWYFGWSNCHRESQQALRNHYTRPHFLPEEGESSHVDWLFMGGGGPGAHIHIDHVGRPSWQAQIKGSKTWNFYPVPECEHLCPAKMSVTMQAGDILIADTNQWYHSTQVHPGELSISIGSEYD